MEGPSVAFFKRSFQLLVSCKNCALYISLSCRHSRCAIVGCRGSRDHVQHGHLGSEARGREDAQRATEAREVPQAEGGPELQEVHHGQGGAEAREAAQRDAGAAVREVHEAQGAPEARVGAEAQRAADVQQVQDA